jgi:hypothetical protein
MKVTPQTFRGIGEANLIISNEVEAETRESAVNYLNELHSDLTTTNIQLRVTKLDGTVIEIDVEDFNFSSLDIVE